MNEVPLAEGAPVILLHSVAMGGHLVYTALVMRDHQIVFVGRASLIDVPKITFKNPTGLEAKIAADLAAQNAAISDRGQAQLVEMAKVLAEYAQMPSATLIGNGQVLPVHPQQSDWRFNSSSLTMLACNVDADAKQRNAFLGAQIEATLAAAQGEKFPIAALVAMEQIDGTARRAKLHFESQGLIALGAAADAITVSQGLPKPVLSFDQPVAQLNNFMASPTSHRPAGQLQVTQLPEIPRLGGDGGRAA